MPSSRRFKPADVNNDGSSGNWTSGLPTSSVGAPNPQIDYAPQAGAPRDVSGGTHVPNIDRGGQPLKLALHAPDPKPFKVK